VARRPRVAIIGGGCAGLSAAHQLTRPDLGDRFEVTLFQAGWRLGGKGASGRGQHDRIEEHGIHVWMGCYENAFRMMRSIYSELEAHGMASRMRTWRDAFTPLPHVGLSHWNPSDGWDVWSTYFPAQPGVPGGPMEIGDDQQLGSNPFSVAGYLRRMLVTATQLLEISVASVGGRSAPPQTESDQWWESRDLVARLQGLMDGRLREPWAPDSILRVIATLAEMNSQGMSQPLWLRAIGLATEACRQWFETRWDQRSDLCHAAAVVDLLLAGARGIVEDRLLIDEMGFNAIDHWDFREWLSARGASQASINSTFIRGLYNLVFAYEAGDPHRPRMSAAVGLRVCVRMFFTYRESIYYRMRSGMGDIVFAPLYRALCRRGVRFEFFHRLVNVGTTDFRQDSGTVGLGVRDLEFLVQARTKTGAPYEPLVDVRGLPCWPSEPLWQQLVDEGASPFSSDDFEAHWNDHSVGRRVLAAGRDFDYVILATGLGEVRHCCSEIVAKLPAWRTMVDHVQTVATQALQLWMVPSMTELGWHRGPIMMTGFHHPFDSWTDMTPLLPEESWPESSQPRSIAYFCNTLPDPPPAPSFRQQWEGARDQVRANAIEFLDREIGALWPFAVGPDGGFRWDVLIGDRLRGARPPDAKVIDSQYFRANVNPSDRYVMSLPGTAKYRISPLDRSVANLTVAGDWTACGIDVGCIEAAVMSGMLAAHALSGSDPPLREIVGYDHP